MNRYVVANWKSHKTMAEVERWLETFSGLYSPDPLVEVIIAPAFVHLTPLWGLLQEHNPTRLTLAVQDLSPFPLGEYTGAVAAEMVRDMVGFAIIGHAERRRYFHETNQEIANKASEAAAAGVRPILCVDRPYAHAQLAALNEADIGELLVGYGPVEAIGIAVAQAPEKAASAIREIQAIVPDNPILYGGSINASNAATYMKIEGVQGLMVGTASLEAEEFARICTSVSQV
jgi:triosephosphate isomerase